MDEKSKMNVAEGCLMDPCEEGLECENYCLYCGFNKVEHRRRVRGKLITGEDGLKRLKRRKTIWEEAQENG